jgi:hypothetical protein
LVCCVLPCLLTPLLVTLECIIILNACEAVALTAVISVRRLSRSATDCSCTIISSRRVVDLSLALHRAAAAATSGSFSS